MKIRHSIRIRSFRFRIALFSVAVSGVVLAVFVSLAFAALHRISMQRIDKDIKEFTHKHLVGPRGPRHWERVSDSLHFFLEDEDENTFILLVKDREGATLYVSPNWPWDLSTDEFARPDASHELKIPLTILQAQLEQAVHEAEPDSDEQRRYVAFGKEFQRLKSITQKLLLLSRIDAGELKLNLRPLNLSQLLEGIVEDSETLAPQLEVESGSPLISGSWRMRTS